MIEWLAAALMVAGGGFCLVAGIGLLRLRDVYARMHAATKAGALGLGLVRLAAALLADTWAGVVVPLVVLLFMLASAPVGAHLIGRAAFRTGAPVAPGTQEDPGAAAFRTPPAPE
ncbi:monovalent cation/H(+) antiporter subunit G [Amaricoccus sp.]|uniref:monovalent cation/H(+) antiporter subunit G n=1 Tax=Amaricoccus sp. TaxID=1872485 RepID=UPI001B63FD76|nr:monovalent cation/H(+) antiporter subunit G [Amaricoccus sp.]MBP7002372.1 monovalent cation/H(+) antiporter subunit G [Amaricoccus sp.]